MQTGGRKRKQQDADGSDEEADRPVHAKPSKRARHGSTAKQPAATSGTKRSAANADMDDETNSQPAKKAKTDSGSKTSSRGRSGQDHTGKKCCNTCQAWKDISDFAPKKGSKDPTATVGYCQRCQTNKQTKNREKAEAKEARKRGTQTGNSITPAEADEDIEPESDGNEPDPNKTLDDIVVQTGEDASKSGTQMGNSTTADRADDESEHGSGGDEPDPNQTLDMIVVQAEG